MLKMPAEWEKQQSILLAWPHHQNDWPESFPAIITIYATIIRHITRHQNIRLIVRNEDEGNNALDICKNAGADGKKITIHVVSTNHSWIRDTGPMFIKDSHGNRHMLDWQFNAWAKYNDYQLDNDIPAQLEPSFKLPRIQPMYKGKRIVLEGGAIDVNGKGTLITTEECLLSSIQERNIGLTRNDYEKIFANYLGAEHVIWLKHGIVGDSTHGHINNVCRFVSDTTLIAAVEHDHNSPNHKPLAHNLKRLQNACDQHGKPLTIIEIPLPDPIYANNKPLPASYTNFLITNKLILVPIFNDPADGQVLPAIKKCFPRHEVIGIPSHDLVLGLGTIHCISQQEPT